MKLFFSGVGAAYIELDPRLGNRRYRLFSCHANYYKYAVTASTYVVECGSDAELMYDSGAFTAWTKGEEVKLEDLVGIYSKMIDDFEPKCKAVYLINLDKIPGEKGRTAGEQEIIDAGKISDDNYHVLKERFGQRVLPVFHQNESQEYLMRLASEAEYICVSPRNDLPERHRVSWSKEVHALIKNKTHGLATTGLGMMTKVPWHSVDSATWIMLAAYGKIYADEKLTIIPTSRISPERHDQGKHLFNLTDQERDVIATKMAAWGFTEDQLADSFVDRAIWNRKQMTVLYEGIGDINVPLQGGLFKL